MLKDRSWIKETFNSKRYSWNRWNFRWSHFIHSHGGSILWPIPMFIIVLGGLAWVFHSWRILMDSKLPTIDPYSYHHNRLSLLLVPSRANRTSSSHLLSNSNHQLNHAIIVCAHAVWSGKRSFEEYLEPDAWVLDERWFLDENTSITSIRAYMETLKTGLELMMHKEHVRSSLLILSGGQTRASAGPISEAWSYYQVARHHNWIVDRQRVILEEYARDSFENLLFSLCRFYEVTGHYPNHVTVISLDMKRKRFEEIYRMAIGFPKESFKFLGIPLVSSLSSSTSGSSSPVLSTNLSSYSDRSNHKTSSLDTLNSFLKDPYGCFTPNLIEKRHHRNPFRRTPAYDSTCPQMTSLIHYCGPSFYYPSTRLPWS
jgi:hypothetical protein